MNHILLWNGVSKILRIYYFTSWDGSIVLGPLDVLNGIGEDGDSKRNRTI